MEHIQDDYIDNSYIPGNIPVNNSRSYNDQLDFIKELLKKDELKAHISEDLEIYFDSIVKKSCSIKLFRIRNTAYDPALR
ncbi:hypothetical protein [Methanosarcina horonobensis]|uniref:hypothetical protein n=1 Tax=Methanosarcina horonobensis TaxID=418008 RepID=UPI000AEFABB1|nr:hypothetical protein [Methanosarcina horonobensis]